MDEILKFKKKEDWKWYVVLDDWTGPQEDLEMVQGADTMLDILSEGKFDLDLRVSTEPFDSTFILESDLSEDGGMWYNLTSDLFAFPVWLCYVTKHVFGEFPNKIYISTWQ